jgi:hypothetical protein
VEAVDQQSGHVYEYNAKTKETRWKVAKPGRGEGGEGGEGRKHGEDRKDRQLLPTSM